MYIEFEKCLWSFDNAQLARVYSLLKIIGGFVLPFLIIISCYVYIFAKNGVWFTWNNLKIKTSKNHTKVKSRSLVPTGDHSESTMSKLILIIILTFFVTWLPNQALNLYMVIVPDSMYWPALYQRLGPLTQVSSIKTDFWPCFQLKVRYQRI